MDEIQVGRKFSNGELTLSNQHIAEAAGKEHKNIVRDIRNILNQLEQGSRLRDARMIISHLIENPILGCVIYLKESYYLNFGTRTKGESMALIKESDFNRIKDISVNESIKMEDVVTLALDLMNGEVRGELEVCYDQQDIKRLCKPIECGDSAVYVYVIRNKDNKKCYYGVTEKLTSRTSQHRMRMEKVNHQNDGINNCIKLGRRKFEMHLIGVFPNREEAERKELELIQNDKNSYNILGTEKGGRPARNKKDIERALKLYDEREENGHSVNDIAKLTGVPRSTIYHELQKRKKEEV